ncbi:IspD/TarI family cytidylyltransferase [Vibrio breoganii]|nr:IspD/TarI family cytidylyltransferase [Vibrio breoganii]PMF64821.1 2-C-methyl-D-erythritol 4-phosphate cytidylyltransferase [Vibrio breoganii]PMH15357.1 2-C-methyl-D-erythritol 4-phosphate cytidylyltransferase [Vibrio breoganii]PMK51530.1 2-C-methyl-D-erythritol 4-phosphate cytidylyltransferase [Vibrio breoganii]PMM12700.1 2-C-methyl-D-erythritol 4-phosphate cytidylyltransferase [Vibrio breoganii]TKG17094.1 2-C-methyl-D-erythritol 4-phosphate cytidylyltransferase [Vibrio breoganii]
MNIALLTAAGVGSRMKQEIPKQFLHVNNKPLIVYTMEKFQNHPSIDKILIVTLPSWMDVLQAYAKQYGITKLEWIVAGGDSGQESILNGLTKLKDDGVTSDDVIMIHDGNRCNVSPELISDSLSVYKSNGSAVAAIPCIEAVFKSDDGGKSSVISIPREQLFRTQTPHTYSLGNLLWAHEQAAEKNIEDTAASCVLMQRLGETVYFSKGLEDNLKITTYEDLGIFQSLLTAQSK